MNPPLLMVMRYAKEPFSVTTSDGKTYVVPKVGGWGPCGGAAVCGMHCLPAAGSGLGAASLAAQVGVAHSRTPRALAHPPTRAPTRRATLWRPAPPSATACPTCFPTPTRTSPTALRRRARRTSRCTPTSASAAAATRAWCAAGAQWAGLGAALDASSRRACGALLPPRPSPPVSTPPPPHPPPLPRHPPPTPAHPAGPELCIPADQDAVERAAAQL